MFRQNAMNTLCFERLLWLAIDPPADDEEPHAIEDFVYHRPVLQREVLGLLKPKPGFSIVDGTCGGGGHTEAPLQSGADVLALDHDPDAVQHVSERLPHVRRASWRERVTGGGTR